MVQNTIFEQMQSDSDKSVIRTNSATICVLENNIFHVLYDADVGLEKSDFIESYSAYHNFTKESPLRVLIEFPLHTYASSEARQYAMDTRIPAIAEAIVFKTLSQRLIIRFYLLVNKQEHPVKIFTSSDEAIEWLNTIG